MTTFNLQALTEKDPLITKIKAALESSTGQAAPYTTLSNVQRVAGVSIRTLEFGLENGQQVAFLIRNTGDIFRVQLNSKDLPLATDFDHEYGELFKQGMNEIGQAVRKNQKAFDDKKAKGKIVIPKAAPNNKVKTTAQKLKDAESLRDELAKAKEQGLAENARLKSALAQAQGQTQSTGDDLGK
jgi:hypothetical protein